MKTYFRLFILVSLSTIVFNACRKAQHQAASPDSPSREVLEKIKSMGFSTASVQKIDDDYLVEGDILITKEYFQKKNDDVQINVGNEEQYRVSNTVLGTPRTITVRVNAALPVPFVVATDAAIARYNALYNPGSPLGITIRFQRVTVGGEIVINPAPAGAAYLASAGFPSVAGNPYHQILLNAPALNPIAANTKITLIAHEIGHCLGFAHTDHLDPAFSCGPGVFPAVGTRFIHIPGTPVGPDSGSWMLQCLSNGTNRPFTSNDRVALRWLY